MAAMKDDRTLAELAQAFHVHGNPGAVGAFGPGPAWPGPNTSAPDLKAMHDKIGELTLENDFLEGALIKAGMLSARR
jgi:hypothetical protein